MSSLVHRTVQPPPRRRPSVDPSRPQTAGRPTKPPPVAVPIHSPRGLKTDIGSGKVAKIGSLSLGNTLFEKSPRKVPVRQTVKLPNGKQLPSHILMPETQQLPHQASPRAAKLAKQLSTGTALSTAKRKWNFLGEDHLGLQPRQHYPDPPLECYHTQSRLAQQQAEQDAKNLGETFKTGAHAELIDVDGDGEPDVAVGGGGDASATMQSIRADLNVSPTRRYGKVIMLDHNAGMLLDQDNKWVLRFDPRDQVVTVKVAQKISYNRLHDQANGMHSAVRLMKSHRSRKRRQDEEADNSTSVSGFYSENGSDCGSAMSSLQTSPTNQDLSPLQQVAPSLMLSRRISDDGVVMHPEGGVDLTATQDEEFDLDNVGLGLEYHTFLMKAKGKKGIDISSDPDSINKLVEKLRKEFEFTINEETEKRQSSPQYQQEHAKARSIFYGKGNRAPDSCADEWEKKTYGGGRSATNAVCPARYSHWFMESTDWMHNYEEAVQSARGTAEKYAQKEESKKKHHEETLRAATLQALEATRNERSPERRLPVEKTMHTMATKSSRSKQRAKSKALHEQQEKKPFVSSSKNATAKSSRAASIASGGSGGSPPRTRGSMVSVASGAADSGVQQQQMSSSSKLKFKVNSKKKEGDGFVVGAPRPVKPTTLNKNQVSPYRIRSTEITKFVRRFTAVHPESPIALAASKTTPSQYEVEKYPHEEDETEEVAEEEEEEEEE